MLEDLIKSFKHKFLPLALAFAIPANQASAFSSQVVFQGRLHRVEVAEDLKMIQVEAKDWFDFYGAAMIAHTDHQKALLEKDIENLNYGIYALAKDSISQSRVLSKDVNKVLEWIDQEEGKIPWWTFVYYGVTPKFIALKEVGAVKREVSRFLKDYENKGLGKRPETYNEVLYLRSLVKSTRELIEDVRKVTDLSFPLTLEEMSKLERNIPKHINYADIERIEKTTKDIVARLEESLKESGISRQHQWRKDGASRRKKSATPLIDIVKAHMGVKDPPVTFFRESQERSLLDGLGKKTGGTNLELAVKRACQKDRNYTLTLDISTLTLPENDIHERGFIDAPRTSIFLFYHTKASLAEVSQSATTDQVRSGKVESETMELLRSNQDKIGIDAIKATYTEVLHTTAKGHVMQLRNILPYIAKKLSGARRARVENARDSVDDGEGLEGYTIVEIPLIPTIHGASSYHVSMPLRNLSIKPAYLFLSVGVKDWGDKARGQLENILIEIPNRDMDPVESEEVIQNKPLQIKEDAQQAAPTPQPLRSYGWGFNFGFPIPRSFKNIGAGAEKVGRDLQPSADALMGNSPKGNYKEKDNPK